MNKFLWFKDTYSRQHRITKMLFVECKEPYDINLKTGERNQEGPPYYQTSMKKMPIDGVVHKVYLKDRLMSGSFIYVNISNVWYRGKGFLFTDKLFTTKKKLEKAYNLK